jgi:inner membrane protein
MDNLSHSVVGLAAGEILHRSLPQESDLAQNRLRRRLLLIAGWLASNFPDLDLVLTPLLTEPLGYLLHHRGHTHTLLYAVPQAVLLWGLLWLAWPSARRLLRQSTSARTGLLLTMCAGFALHMLMDYLNSYGIHPFHPFDSRWLYGDMAFIVEPLFWVAFGVPLIMTIQRTSVKFLFMAMLLGTLLFFTLKEFLPWISFAVLVVLIVIVGAVQYKADSRSTAAFILAVMIGIGFVGVQGFASSQATQVVMQHSKSKDPESRFLDASMSSFPANPFCWTFVSVESREADDIYRLRRGALSLAPHIIPVSACPASFSAKAIRGAEHPAIVFYSEDEGKLNTLRELYRNNCHFNAWMRFARTPLVNEEKATDVRFSSTPRGNFTTMNFDDFKNRACFRHIPNWGIPRSDLLNPAIP